MDSFNVAKIALGIIVVFIILWFIGGFIWSILWWMIKVGVVILLFYFAWKYLKNRFSS